MTERALLDTIRSPDDLRRVPLEQLPQLAAEIRAELLAIVSRCGGHLASNLGVVELTIALLRVFDIEEDRIIWDTGHQGYTYKLLTGRREQLQRLRLDDGCCGFLSREESESDVFGAGHAGTAISAALGFAVARDRAESAGRVVAVVGDGALGTGVALEGLNSVIETTRDFVLVLNDNRMSIAPNVGALSRYLNRIITGGPYNRIKAFLRDIVTGIPRIGPRLRRLIQRLEAASKSLLVPGVLFEELGLRYVGPLDGHDLPGLVASLESVRRLRVPLVVHVLTQKGRGYALAETAPEAYHGLGPFDPASGHPLAAALDDDAPTSFSASLGQLLGELFRTDDRLIAITAGMAGGTGLNPLREEFGKRFFDVGIAEEHAVVFAAGLAAAGHRPIVAIYASFMQRAVDYVFHDVCLQNLPVVFCLDRAGVVADGPTHHGIHDLAFWRGLPNIAVLQPADAWELGEMLRLLLSRSGPGVIRYPKARPDPLPVNRRAEMEWGKAEILRTGGDVAIWALGREAMLALEAADALAVAGIDAAVVNVRFIVPFDQELLLTHAADMPLVTLEDHTAHAGLGGLVKEVLAGRAGVRFLCRGWPRETVPWGTTDGIRRKFRLDRESLVADITQFLAERPSTASGAREEGR